METGIFSKILSWVHVPRYSDETTIKDWVAALALILIVAFLWSTVINLVKG